MRTAALAAVAVSCLAIGSASGAVAGGAVTGAQVKNSTVTGKDVKDRGLSAADFAAGVQGPAGKAGASGTAASDPGYGVTVDPAHLDVSVPPGGQVDDVVVSCPAGKTALGGTVNGLLAYLSESHRVDGHPDQWSFSFNNTTDGTLHYVPLLYCTT